MTDIETLLDEIQFKTKETLEQVASKIGYSRSHLNILKKKVIRIMPK